MIRLVAFILLFPVIEAIILVEIHRDAVYRPSSPQAFIRNDSLSRGASIQTCTWLCVQDRDCQTAVYFNVAQNCSLFSEFCRDGSFEPSRMERASVLCYEKHHGSSVSSSLRVSMTTYASTTAQTPTSETIRPITFSPMGLYPVNISSCATWQQTGVTVAGNTSGNPGSGASSLSSPVGFFIDQNTSLFIADRDNNRIVKYDRNGTIGVIVADNSGSNQLNCPRSVAVDRYGFIIVADSLNHRVLNFSNRSHSTVVIENRTNLLLGELYELHIDMNNSVYVIDLNNAQIIRVMSNGTAEIILLMQNGNGSTASQLSSPHGFFVSQNGTWYIADTFNHRIQMLPAQATNGITVAGVSGTAGNSSAHLSKPYAVLVDDNGNIYVADGNNGRIMRWPGNSTFNGTCIVGCTGSSGSAANEFKVPRDLKFDRDGNLYVVDRDNHRVQKFLIQQSSCASSG